MTMRSALAAVLVLGLTIFGLSFPSSAQQRDDISALNERLFKAVRANDIATVRLVLTNGADPMAVDASGQTAAGVAIDRGYFDIAHHILGVRNQRQAILKRDADEERNNPRGVLSRTGAAPAVPAMATAEPQERRPDVTWREKSVPGQAAEIPTPRLSSPQEPVVITPALASNGPFASRAPAAPKKAPEKAQPPKIAAATPAPATAPSQTALVNLPVLPAGAPNPFDPKSVEPEAPPILSTTAPQPAATQAADANRPRETSSGNPLSRFFNGITGVFGGGS